MSAFTETVAREHRGAPADLKRALSERFGERFTDSVAICQAHGQGEAHHPHFPPDGVVFAESAADVVALVRMCAEQRTPVIAFGAGTSLEGNFAALAGGISLDLSRMNKIVRVNAADMDCTIEPGVTRLQLNHYLRDQGLFFPVDPGADATIGGMAATRASGTNAVRYGTMRDNVIALEVVLADGRTIKTATRARKSAAGYDLTRLFVGSEGTLGIITELTLKLHPIPEASAVVTCPFATLDQAVQAVIELIQIGVPVARVELLNDMQMRALNRWTRSSYAERDTLFLEFHGSAARIAEDVEAFGAIARAHGGEELLWSATPEESSRLWKARHEALYAALALRPGSKAWTTDVCVPISQLAACIGETSEDIASSTLPATIVGHVGDGNFHVVFLLDPDRPEDLVEADRLNDRLITRAQKLDGTCTGEHGIGWGKIDALEAELGQAVDVMRTIKQALDPRNILNPGKIFRTPQFR